MAIPVYLWLYEEDGKLLKGGVDVNGREGSISWWVCSTTCLFPQTI